MPSVRSKPVVVKPSIRSAVALASACDTVVENLESRRLMAAGTVQTLPFRLDFNASVADSLLDKDGEGTGFTRTQVNKNGNDYQPALLDLDTVAGVLKLTTTGNSAAGSNSGTDNTQVNALETQFDGTTSGFQINTRLKGPLSYLNESNEQAGIFFGPDQDNYIKLTPAYTSTGPALQFVMETKSSSGTVSQLGGNSADRVAIGSFANITTLDLRLVGDAVTGKVSAFYSINGAAFQQFATTFTVPSFNQSSFFGSRSRAGLVAYHKNNSGAITATYDSFEILAGTSVAGRPVVTGVTPANNATDVSRDAYVAVDVRLPNEGHGVDAASLTNGHVKLVRTSDGKVIAANVNTSGGGDAIVLQPSELLQPNTQYTFILTDGVTDTLGTAFVPFSSTFVTGTSGGVVDSSIAFEHINQSVTAGETFTCVTMGPDGKLYASTHEGKIIRYVLGADGSLGSPQIITTIQSREGASRLITGIVFHPDATASNLTLYVSHGEFAYEGASDWTGKITKLSGNNLQNGVDLVTGLPRSVRDHLNNQIVFGPDKKLYMSQASMTAMGAPDSAWGNRSEHLLSGAVLQINLDAITTPVNVRTEGVANPYNPFAANAAVKIFASGVRNAYDLVWTRAGNLYAPTNGSASGGNTPTGSSYGTRVDDGVYGPWTNGPTVTGANGTTKTQNDFLFKLTQNGYYGQPNPTRSEYVLNGGNPTANYDYNEVLSYPVGTNPDRNYRGAAFDFGRNYSPNGVIEFKGNAFGGKLDGKLLVVRYSAGDDVIVLTPDSNGDIVASQSGITGLSGFIDPLDITQDPTTGFLYVAEYGGQKITLLRPMSTTGGNIASEKPAYYFNDVTTASGHSAAGPTQGIVIKNTGVASMTITQLTLTGANAGDFVLVNPLTTPITVAAGQSITVNVAMKATAVGIRSATLAVTSTASNAANFTVALRGLGTTGTGGDFEPSLQRILDLYQLPINVGDSDPSTTAHYTTSSGPLAGNDEVLVQRLLKAGTGPVTVELLAVMANTVSPSAKFGWYEAGMTGNKTQLTTIAQGDSQSVAPDTGGAISFDPGTGSFGIYGNFPGFSGRETFSEDALNLWETNAALRRKVRFYPLKDAGGAVVPNAYVFAFEEYNQTFDTNDIVGIIRNVSIAPAQPQLSFQNMDGSSFNDRLVMNRIRDLDTNYPNEVHDTATLRIRNTGSQPMTISSLVINTTANFVFTNYTGGALTIAAGGYYDVGVKFVYNQTGSGVAVKAATLTVNSDDPETPARVVQLGGLWQSNSEANASGTPTEPKLQQIIDVLGYKVTVGSNVNTSGNVTRVGEEVLSSYFTNAENGNITVRLLGAFHQQKDISASSIRWFLQGQTTTTTLFKHRSQQGQSLFPSISTNADLPAQATLSPKGAAIGFKVDGIWSDPTKNVPNSKGDNGHGMRWFIAKDANGNVIPNTYLLCQDYSGVSYSNYDYQDNVYLVTNIKPLSGPSAPANPTATPSGAGITLAWTANTEGNRAGYRVYRSLSLAGTYELVGTTTTATNFTDALAPVGQQSYYKIVAIDVHGTEGAPAVATATRVADTSPPAAPTGLVATGTSGGITIDWANNPEADLAGYNVYRSTTVNGTYVKINSALLTSSDILDATAPSSAVSYYRITAVDSSGNESTAASITATRPSQGAVPNAPTNLGAVANGQTQVTLGWTDNATNETGYRIERMTAGGSFTLLVSLGANVTSYIDTSVSAGTTYTYRVVAIGASGNSAFSNEAAATTAQGIPAPASNLATAASTATSVVLTWADNSGNETGFAIERRIGAGSYVRLITTLANAVTYTDTTVSGNTTYTYRVVALNAVGEAAASNESSVTTPIADAFTSVDIGAPTPAGSTTTITPGKDYDVRVGGTDIWGTADSFRFVYKQVFGDFDVKLRLQDVSAVEQAMAGIMARANLGAGSANVYIKTRPAGFRTSYRTVDGAASTAVGSGAATYPNAYVRLQRVGNTYTTYGSTDGVNWVQNGQVTVDLGAGVYLGMAVSARSQSAATTAKLRDFGDTTPTGTAPTAPSSLVGAGQAGNVSLSWTDNASTETGFRVERRTSSSASWSSLGSVGANSTSFVDATAASGTSYVYRVFAFNDLGDSAASNEAAVNTPVVSRYTSVDINNPTAGSTTEVTADRDFDISGSGADIWGTADSFRYVYRSVSGDFDVVTRVTDFLGADIGSTGGIMVRETAAAGSKHAFIRVRSDNFRFNYRTTTDGISAGVTGSAVSFPNAYLRLQRVGNVMTGYTSTNGVDWTQLGQVSIAMGADVQLGLAVASRKAGSLATVKFRDFADYVSGPAPTVPGDPSALTATSGSGGVALAWTDAATNETGFQIERQTAGGGWSLLATVAANATGYTDTTAAAGTSYDYRVRAINGVGPSGYSNIASVTTTPVAAAFTSSNVGGATGGSTSELTSRDLDMTAGGTDVWANADSFRYAYQNVSGDFDVTVRVSSMTGPDVGSMAGLMVRESLAAGSKQAYMRIRADSFRFNWRDVTDGRSYGVTGASNPLPNAYLRLQRVGNVLTGFSSTNGTTWSQVGSVTLAMGSNVLLGVAASARSATATMNVSFRDYGNHAAPRAADSLVLGGAVENSSAHLAWTTAEVVSGFAVQKLLNGVWSTIASVAADVFSYSDDTFSSSAVYRVQAIVDGTAVETSNELTLTA